MMPRGGVESFGVVGGGFGGVLGSQLSGRVRQAAAIGLPVPMLVPLRMVTPIPIKAWSPTVQPCRTALCPTDTLGPMVPMNRAQESKIVRAWTQRAGILAKLENSRLDEVVLGILQVGVCGGADAIAQYLGAGDEVALPVAVGVAGVPGMWHSGSGYWTL